MKKVDKKNNFSLNEQTFMDYQLPYKDGELGAKASFIQEVAYQNTIEENASLPLYNKIYGNTLYGKVNKKNISVVPQGIFVERIEEANTDQSTFNFVADAYRDFLRKWTKLINKGIVEEDFYNVNIKKGYENIEDVYQKYITDHYLKFVTYIKNNKVEKEINGFDSFLNLFFEYIYLQSRTNSFSLSKFIKTKKCPDTVTGLVLYLDDKKNTYENKIEYIDNDKFVLLNETLNSCGFIVDKNEPWKITFNIYSSVAKKYIDKYGDSNKFYDSFFVKVGSYDLFYFQKIILELYNRFVSENREFVTLSQKICNGKFVTQKNIIERSQIPQSEISQTLTSEISFKWWKFYISTRILEERKRIEQKMVNTIVSEIYQIYQKLDIEPALRYLERTIAQMPAEIGARKRLKL